MRIGMRTGTVSRPLKLSTVSAVTRPKKINVLFPETSEYFLGSVGRQFFLF